MKDFADSDSVRDWLLSVGQGTRKNYVHYLGKFCEFVGLTPEQLVQEAVKDRRLVHRRLKEWYGKHREIGLASSTRLGAYTAVRSFLNWNDIPLGRTPNPFRAASQFETHRILTPTELSLMITIASMTRDKTLISFIAQSGQRTGVLTAMKYGQVRDQLEKRVNPILVHVPADFPNSEGRNMNKTRTKYEFAIGKECTMFLRLMMKERATSGEPVNDSSWLFRSYARPEVRAGKRLVIRVKHDVSGQPMSSAAIRFRVVHIATRAGIQATHPGTSIRGKDVLRHEIHPHMFRRWWKFRMRKAGVTDNALLEYMLGQKDRWLRHGGDYDVFDPDYIRREYARGEPFLTVLTQEERIRVSRAPDIPLSGKTFKPANSSFPPGMPQKVVTEWELDSHLADGWQYIATLPSGRIVIQGSAS